jgi:hypothetical protein
MATQWYYMAFGQELGPLPFRELTRMVRAGELMEEDLVRAIHEPEWRRADTVVGLFHMARRGSFAELDDAARTERAEPLAVTLELDDVRAVWDDTVDDRPEPPRWLLRILERVRGGEISAPETRRALNRLLTGGEPLSQSDIAFLNEAAAMDVRLGATAGLGMGAFAADGHGENAASGAMARAVEDALAEIDERLARGQPKLRRDLLGRLVGHCRDACTDRSLWQQAGRVGGVMVAANVAVLWLGQWSARESLRFPGLQREQGTCAFPLIGACQPLEYWFYLFDLVLLAGAVAYLGVRWIEAHLD